MNTIDNLFAKAGKGKIYESIRKKGCERGDDNQCPRFSHNVCWCEINHHYSICKSYLDRSFPTKIREKHDSIYGCYFELYLAAWLRSRPNIKLNQHKDYGPDFIISHSKEIIYLEATTVGPGKSLPTEWASGIVYDIIFKDIQERIRHCIRDKTEQTHKIEDATTRKNKTSNYFSWKEKKIIDETRPFILAIDVSQIKHDSLTPLAYIGAVAPVGACEFQYNREKKRLEPSTSYQYEESFKKKNGSSVEKDIFLTDSFSHLSAVIITRDRSFSEEPTMLIHNPKATKKIPYGLFKTRFEIIIEEYNNQIVIRDLNNNPIGIS